MDRIKYFFLFTFSNNELNILGSTFFFIIQVMYTSSDKVRASQTTKSKQFFFSNHKAYQPNETVFKNPNFTFVFQWILNQRLLFVFISFLLIKKNRKIRFVSILDWDTVHNVFIKLIKLLVMYSGLLTRTKITLKDKVLFWLEVHLKNVRKLVFFAQHV